MKIIINTKIKYFFLLFIILVTLFTSSLFFIKNGKVEEKPLNTSVHAATISNHTINDFLGVNAVVNNTPSDIGKVAGWVRDFHKWYWYEPEDNVFTWTTSKYHIDTFYQNLKANNVKILSDVEFSPGWASSNGQKDGIPDPVKHAEYLKDLSSFFNSTISAIENYNEPNQTWQPIPFPGVQFGEMTKLDYDAVKSVNPQTIFVLAGLAGLDTAYLDEVNIASNSKFDVINFHWYPSGDSINGGKNPETNGLSEAIDSMRNWRDLNAFGKEIWISEFGWDTFQYNGNKSKIYAPELNAANYLLRSIFIMQSKGIDKGFVYMYRDVYQKPELLYNQYMSCGLVEDLEVYNGEVDEMDGRKKASWYYLATLKNVLGNYVFNQAIENGPNVYHYEYQLPGTNKRAAVIWARDEERDKGYNLSYNAPSGELINFINNSTFGSTSQTDGKITISEKPTIILYTSSASPTPTPGTGNGLKGNYFKDKTFTSLVFTRNDSTVDFNFSNKSPDTRIPNDNFSIRWTGQVMPNYSGNYTFYAKSDDGVRLWLNDRLLINKWVSGSSEYFGTITLQAKQKYNITLEYFEGWGNSSIQLSWTGPQTTKQIIPKSQLFSDQSIPTPTATINITPTISPPPPTSTIAPTSTTAITPTQVPPSVTPQLGFGLTGSYYTGKTLSSLTLTRVDPQINFSWAGASPGGTVPNYNFSVRWTGYVLSQDAGAYTFYTKTDDGVRLWVNNQLLIDKWKDQGAIEYSGIITLAARAKYPITMEYYQGWGGSSAQLLWTTPQTAKQVIPQANLSTN